MHCYMSIYKKYMVEYSLDMQIKMFWYSVYVKIKVVGSSSNLKVVVVVVVVVVVDVTVVVVVEEVVVVVVRVVEVVTYLSDHNFSK